MVKIELANSPGPIVSFTNSQLSGVHNYATLTNNFNFQTKISYENCILWENNEPLNQANTGFILWTNGGNSGGAPQIRFRGCRNQNNAATVGWHSVLDTDCFWQLTSGGVQSVKSVQIVGANSDAPINSTSLTYQLPYNCVITSIRFWKPAGTDSGAFNYTLQTAEATPTVLAGGTGTAMQSAGSAGLAIALYAVNTAPLPFRCNTDLARTIQLVDTLGRTTPFTGYYLVVDYLG
jgi:hypothetical protein